MTRDNCYAFFRYDQEDVVFVYINNSEQDKRLPWTYYSEISSELGTGVNVLTGESVVLSDETVVPAVSALVVEFKR